MSRMQTDICSIVSTIFPVPQITNECNFGVTCIQQIYNLILPNLDIRSCGINMSRVGFRGMMNGLKDQPKLIINTPRYATDCARLADDYCQHAQHDYVVYI